MIEDVEENILQLITRMRVNQRLYRNAVREQKHDAHHREVEQFSELQHVPQSYPSSELQHVPQSHTSSELQHVPQSYPSSASV